MKSPELKMPTIFRDLYRDLRDRRLLPLVGLLVVAIIAVPFLLKDTQPQLSPTQGQVGIPVTAGTPPSKLLVVSDTSTEIRRYTKRLHGLQKRNPFALHFTAPALGTGATTLDSTGTTTSTTATSTTGTGSSTTTTTTDTSTTTPTTTTPTTTTPTTPDQPDGPGGDGTPAVQVETKYVSYEINAKVGEPGNTHIRKGIPELTMLPNEAHPVALFMGVSDDAKKALFLVSNDVTSVFGDVGCGFGDDTCQLLELEPGFPVQFTLGDGKNRYTISVTKITKVTRSKEDETSPKTTGPTQRAALSDAGPVG